MDAKAEYISEYCFKKKKKNRQNNLMYLKKQHGFYVLAMTPQTCFLCSEKGTQYPLNSLNSHSLESSKS